MPVTEICLKSRIRLLRVVDAFTGKVLHRDIGDSLDREKADQDGQAVKQNVFAIHR